MESVTAVGKQVKTSHRAYPLYGLGRMFLNKPERHRVRVTSNAPAHPLYQVGEDGPVTLNRNAAERDAFRLLKGNYYTEEAVQVDPPKGNFSNVARCRLSGTLLGPTNHHGYQPALRKLYEARFSRRMDFNEFLRQIEIVSDPAVVEEWKKQCSTVAVHRTSQEAEPMEFKSHQEVEAHFRQTYLPSLIRCGRSLEMSGVASRDVGDNQIRNAIRAAWEKERGFPMQVVNHLRPRFTEIGLHLWKHRKRILYVSAVRPLRFGAEAKDISAHVADVLNIIETSPKCTRADIATHLLKPHEGQEDYAKIKTAVASDLHWLVQSGHVIEFHDGTLDLPLLPKDLAKEIQGQEAMSSEEAKGEEPSAAVPSQETPEIAAENAPTIAVSEPIVEDAPTIAASEPIVEDAPTIAASELIVDSVPVSTEEPTIEEPAVP